VRTLAQPENQALLDPSSRASSPNSALSRSRDVVTPPPPSPPQTPDASHIGLTPTDQWTIEARTSGAQPFGAPHAGASMHFNGTELVVSLTGELDLAGVLEVEGTLRAARSERVRSLTLHLCGVEFIDSHGTAAIANIAASLGAEGKVVTLRSASRRVLRVLRITGVDQLVSLDPHLCEWRPMIPASSTEPHPSRPYAYVRADTAKETAARNHAASKETDPTPIRPLPPFACPEESDPLPDAS
jgi:anti-sigma B factor antagonist